MSHIISLTGDLGSGKSTVSRILIERLGYGYVYTGKIQRDIAERYRMTTLELNRYAETHPEIDAEIDATFRSLGNSSGLIVDSRLAWFFLPASFKVFLKTNPAVSAERISGDTGRGSERYASKEEACAHIAARKASENKRYMELYGADCADLSHFNLLVDTSFIPPEKVAGLILSEYHLWTQTGACAKAFVAPANLYPTLPARDMGACSPDVPVTVMQVDSFDYIIEGHACASWALRKKDALIPVSYTRDPACKERIPKPACLNLLHEWEEFNSFKYLLYPR